MEDVMLTELGWNEYFQKSYESAGIALPVGRVTAVHANIFLVTGPWGPLEAQVSGRLSHLVPDASFLPVTGDWVYLMGDEGSAHALISGVLERRTSLSRKKPGADTPQVLAANVDRILIVSALDETFSVSRIERYLSLALEGGIGPILVFNKMDLAADLESAREQVARTFPDVPCAYISAVTGAGMEGLEGTLAAGETAVLAGPSGAGKSTILNRLRGDESIRTGAVRARDGKGRHTTSAREIYVLPGGAIVIDTPGLREVGIWTDSDGVEEVFEDIHSLAAGCRFGDCTHTVEPGCAVIEALASGVLDERRYGNYLKMRSEAGAKERSPKWKGISREIKRFYAHSDKYK
ncbi:MAG: ribosome small subunit-dependent GTPase A [Spirochaetes bacterium]|nr:MAG: ribosome small subunit-dependent GTPase A [Spirochaetota bacterium]